MKKHYISPIALLIELAYTHALLDGSLQITVPTGNYEDNNVVDLVPQKPQDPFDEEEDDEEEEVQNYLYF